jgi:hypothetical protein
MEGQSPDLDGLYMVLAGILSAAALVGVWLAARRSDSGLWRTVAQLAGLVILGYATGLVLVEQDLMLVRPSGDISHSGEAALMFLALNFGIVMIGWIIALMVLRALGSAARSRAEGASR